MTNREILDIYLKKEDNLVRRCVDCQFAKFRIKEPWKMQYKEDLYQDLIVILLEYDNDKLNDVHNKGFMNALITRILINNLYSKSSKFYHQYLRFNLSYNPYDDVIDDTEDDE